MNKTNKSDPSKKIKKSGWRTTAIVTGIVVGTYSLLLIIPFVSPFAWYPLYIVKCGKLPIVASSFAAGYTYDLPGDKHYGVDIFTDHYFCTEAEAQHSFNHNPWEEN